MPTRRLVVSLAPLTLAAAGLGLVGAPAPEASCAGPQLSVGDQSSVPTEEARAEENGDAVYSVTTAEPLRFHASNLVDGCQDTYVTQPGCRPGQPTPVQPAGPLQDLRLVLRQDGHRWTLARADAPAADLTFDATVRLPATARPGRAVLELTSKQGLDSSIAVRIR